jgi:hypothetical protein
MKTIHKLLPLTLCCLFVLTSCSKVTKAETKTVSATIVSTKHEAVKIIPYTVIVNNQVTIRNQIIPEKNIVTVDYNGTQETFNNKSFYEKCKNSVGKKTKVNLITRYYDNGKVTYRLELIGSDKK